MLGLNSPPTTGTAASSGWNRAEYSSIPTSIEEASSATKIEVSDGFIETTRCGGAGLASAPARSGPDGTPNSNPTGSTTASTNSSETTIRASRKRDMESIGISPRP